VVFALVAVAMVVLSIMVIRRAVPCLPLAVAVAVSKWYRT
jgi:hypothetical protein